MSYTKVFAPSPIQAFAGESPTKTSLEGDRRDGLVYVYTDEIILAVNIAIVTGRPLLVRGPSGSGKSSLALNVARVMKWPYFEEVISFRTQARDLLWQFDALRRLHDAQVHQLQPITAYVKPGVLWRAFDPEGSKNWEFSSGSPDNMMIMGTASNVQPERAVVLLDEIDKADPDVPNNLLVPLGSYQFVIQETGTEVKLKGDAPPLTIITTNDERGLSSAFLRRCVVLVLQHPDEQRLVEIAKAHFGPISTGLYESVARLIIEASQEQQNAMQITPSAAEYLDTVRACRDLGVTPDANNEIWKVISKIVLWKPRDPVGGV